MLGYKVYYDKDQLKFVYNETVSEVYAVGYDSPTMWFYTLSNAKNFCDSNNDHTGDYSVKICKDCGAAFLYSIYDDKWLHERGLKPYSRCYKCRKIRKKEKKDEER